MQFFLSFPTLRFFFFFLFLPISIAGGLVLIAPGSSSQILLGVLITLFYILAFVRFLPCAEIDNDQTQFVSSLQILLTLLAGFALKTESNETGMYERRLMDFLLNFMAIMVFILTSLALLTAWFPRLATYFKGAMMVVLCKCHGAKELCAERLKTEEADLGEEEEEEEEEVGEEEEEEEEEETVVMVMGEAIRTKINNATNTGKIFPSNYVVRVNSKNNNSKK